MGAVHCFLSKFGVAEAANSDYEIYACYFRRKSRLQESLAWSQRALAKPWNCANQGHKWIQQPQSREIPCLHPLGHTSLGSRGGRCRLAKRCVAGCARAVRITPLRVANPARQRRCRSITFPGFANVRNRWVVVGPTQRLFCMPRNQGQRPWDPFPKRKDTFNRTMQIPNVARVVL